MSSNTKQVLAITLGSLGLVIGIFGAITAYNAKKATDNEGEVAAQVQQQFTEAQTRQDELEKSQASQAEKLIAGLSKGEKALIKKINANSKGIKKLKRQNRGFRKRLNTLTSRDRGLSSEIDQLENDQQSDYNTLNSRINKTNQQVKNLQQSLNRLRTRVGVDEINP